MIAVVITAASFIWPLIVLVAGAVIWHTRGRHARQRRLQIEAEHREYRALVDAAAARRESGVSGRLTARSEDVPIVGEGRTLRRVVPAQPGEVNQLLLHEAVCPRLGPDGKCNCGSR